MSTLNPALIALMLGAIITPCGAQTLDDRVRGCDTCHGAQGVPRDKGTPVIWGQQQGYIDSALSDFKKGLRVSEAMAASVQDLGRLDIVAISMHYAEKPWPDLQQASAPSVIAQRAEHLIPQGQCTASGCHVGFVGEFARPRVAGQSEEYLRAALKAYQNKTRSSYEPMEEAVKSMSDADIQALATYLAGLKQ